MCPRLQFIPFVPGFSFRALGFAATGQGVRDGLFPALGQSSRGDCSPLQLGMADSYEAVTEERWFATGLTAPSAGAPVPLGRDKGRAELRARAGRAICRHLVRDSPRQRTGGPIPHIPHLAQYWARDHGPQEGFGRPLASAFTGTGARVQTPGGRQSPQRRSQETRFGPDTPPGCDSPAAVPGAHCGLARDRAPGEGWETSVHRTESGAQRWAGSSTVLLAGGRGGATAAFAETLDAEHRRRRLPGGGGNQARDCRSAFAWNLELRRGDGARAAFAVGHGFIYRDRRNLPSRFRVTVPGVTRARPRGTGGGGGGARSRAWGDHPSRHQVWRRRWCRNPAGEEKTARCGYVLATVKKTGRIHRQRGRVIARHWVRVSRSPGRRAAGRPWPKQGAVGGTLEARWTGEARRGGERSGARIVAVSDHRDRHSRPAWFFLRES